MPNYAFHPESRNTMIARVELTQDGVVQAGYIPCYIDQQVRPAQHRPPVQQQRRPVPAVSHRLVLNRYAE